MTHHRAAGPDDAANPRRRSVWTVDQLRAVQGTAGWTSERARFESARRAALEIADTSMPDGHEARLVEVSTSERTGRRLLTVECACGKRWHGAVEHVQWGWGQHRWRALEAEYELELAAGRGLVDDDHVAPADPRGVPCPQCREPGVEILYGLPGPGLLAAADRGEVQLGGCIIEPTNPTHACPRGHTWQQAP